MSKNVLIICGQFVPFTRSLGNSIRLLSFGLTLKKKYKINYLFTGSNFFSYFGFREEFKNFKLYKVSNKNIFSYINFILFRILFPSIGYLLSYDYASCYYENILKKSRILIKKKKIKYVILSAPPFSFFKIGPKLKSEFGNEIKIIFDYRDGWTTRFDNSNFLINFLKKNSDEKELLKSSDKIICSTETIFNSLKKLANKKKIYLIKNGYLSVGKTNSKKFKKINKKIKIGYFGLVSDKYGGYRDINILYKALTKNSYLKDNLMFEFYGDNIIKNKLILNFKPFKFYKSLNYQKARKKMCEMDYLLILHTEKKTGKEVITGKFYDYVATNVPILSITEGQIEANKIIKKHSLGLSINYLKTDLKNNLEGIIKKKIGRKKVNLKPFSREYQNQTLSKIFN